MACQIAQSECARLLIKEGNAGVQERNSKTDWVPLHEAALRGHIECCKVLLQFNAPLRPRTQDKDTPRDLAMRYGKNTIVELLGNNISTVSVALIVYHNLDTADVNYPSARTKTSQWLHSWCDRTVKRCS